jgi:hypothetical protein
MRNRLLSSLALISLLLCLTVACGGGAETGTDQKAEAPAPETSALAAAPAAGPLDFSEADLDLYARGIAQETSLVKAAQERASTAATPAERGAAAQEQWEEQTIPAAAKAANIPEDRYRQTRTAVHTVFETLDFQGKIDGPMEMDLTRASDEAKAKLAQDPFTTLTPGAAAALRARMDRLVPLWVEYVSLTAVNG